MKGIRFLDVWRKLQYRKGKGYNKSYVVRLCGLRVSTYL